ncbi:hypothetical protein JZ751_028089 [Albula glossodonta]|uniref:T-cell surface glycoprotein CD3 zeta chain n=1 Tax=Albula glossodonta TaxID=121402 RepID=A0A8T2PEM4_9TELE|nr:hypothetical protein JZ751_028089 [Albula glossodonta]
MLCYILDGVLLLYGLIVTALFFRERFFKSKPITKEEGIYMDLKQPADLYDDLMHRGEGEGGATAARGNRRQDGNETYTRLNKQTDDNYKEIGVKKERRRNKPEQVYQDLNKGTKDTYESLHMQPLPPR